MALPLPLIGPEDPAPVEVLNGRARLVLSVEHAGRAVPRALRGLGLAEADMARHIGWDPGAADLARVLAGMTGATAVMQPYSRLVIDCNRPRGAADLCASVSDGTPVPANRDLTEADIAARWDAIHAPFHAALSATLDHPGCRGLVAVHSYDPRRRGDAETRPWPIGLLWRQDNPLAAGLAQALGAVPEAQPLGLNQPYVIDDTGDYTIPVHVEPRRLPHVLLEVRNDHLGTPAQVAAIARLLAQALSTAGALP